MLTSDRVNFTGAATFRYVCRKSRWRKYVPPKRRYHPTNLYDVTTQNTGILTVIVFKIQKFLSPNLSVNL
jgi:hypothetical protein